MGIRRWAKHNPKKALFIAWLTPGVPPPGPFGDDMHVAADVVERARQGDQNAMAVIVMVAKKAKEGNARAQVAFQSLKKYILSHPPGFKKLPKANREAFVFLKAANHESDFGAMTEIIPTVGRGVEPACGAAVVLANGQMLDKPRLTAISDATGAKKAFVTGFRRGGRTNLNKVLSQIPKEEMRAFYIGWIVGFARGIQACREGASFGMWPDVAWELGE